MPPPTTTSLLKSETAHLAKRINIQNALPGAMKALPLVAMGAGAIAANIVGGRNVVEDRLLGSGTSGGGAEMTVLLGEPGKGEGEAEGEVLGAAGTGEIARTAGAAEGEMSRTAGAGEGEGKT
ncbi:hypothetical protein FQN55_005747 [Onygenales sp. PD_40]|nr:hypothetical protein FQN55_005747 [Onygenales sp. PD_40]KAK2788366.1 hypothetical protein FQN52_006690 [Onygenales sp. PD_12]